MSKRPQKTPNRLNCPTCGADQFEIIEVKRCEGVISGMGEIRIHHREHEVWVTEVTCLGCRTHIFNAQTQGALLEPLEDVFSLPLPLTAVGCDRERS